MRENSQDIWQDLGALDPMWAVLADARYRFGKWDQAEFFRIGEADVERLMQMARTLGYPAAYETALDFGCGVGRLTRALAKHFARCYGVDISETMIAQAQSLHRAFPNCQFRVIQNDLRLFDDNSLDLIYTVLTLQHIPSRAAVAKYIREFMRTLRRNGLLVFQVPSNIPFPYRLQPQRKLYGLLKALGMNGEFLYRRLKLVPIQNYFVPERYVVDVLKSHGATILDIERHTTRMLDNRTYYVTKRAE